VPSYRDTTGAYNRDGWVRLKGPVSPASVAAASAKLSNRPRARLFVADVKDTDLGFLADVPQLDGLEIILSGVRDVSALVHHARSLQHLHLELGRHPVTVDVVGALPHLRQLYLRKDGPAAVKGAPEAIVQATALEHLVLHSLTLPSVTPLPELPRLRGLALKLGSAPDLTAFPHLPALRFFEAWQVRGLTDLSPVTASRTLEVLHLESLRRATLPDFSGAASLAHVRVDNLPLAEGLAGLAAAPALRQLYITRRVFDADEVAVLRDHPTLQAAWVPQRGRVPDEEMRLGLDHPHNAPFVAFGAGVMGLPPDGWDGVYTTTDSTTGSPGGQARGADH
jgi:hypothetical protein